MDGPIVGYRAWIPHPQGPFRDPARPALQSPMVPTDEGWPITTFRPALCVPLYPGESGPVTLPEIHRAPSERCHCGWYALSTVEGLRRSLDENGSGRTFEFGRHLPGAIVAWGEVLHHRRPQPGFRAEYARPIALAYTPYHRLAWMGLRRLRRFARWLELPLMPLDRLEAYAREHGRAAR